MARCHLVRVGAMGHVGRFASLDPVRYERTTRVILRTTRGLETGEVLSLGEDVHRSQTDGVILRGMTVEDELLESRLNKHKHRAFAACSRRIAELGLNVTLIDVEHLFDGRSLFFYFLGESPPELENVLAELAEVYDANVQFRRFSDTLTAGCGPGCGTESAGGCGDACGSCAISGACGTGKMVK
jgi:cell fate regulator YaaT (PSP1 superfamily)